MKKRKDIDLLLDRAVEMPLYARVSIIFLFAFPILIMIGWDMIGRLKATDNRTISAPWEVQLPIHSETWGDLIRIAGLPRYERIFANQNRQKSVSINQEGFRNTYSKQQFASIVITGASFCAAGSSNDQTLAAQIERFSGLRTRNIAWPGGGPVLSMLYYLTQDALASEEQIIIWCIVERSLLAREFRPLNQRIDKEGSIQPLSTILHMREFIVKVLRWPQQLESYLMETSAIRKAATPLAKFLPPMAIDPGWSSSVKMAMLDDKAILFYDSAIRSVFMSFEDRGGGTIIEAISRVHLNLCDQNKRLLVVLIPDKYEIFRGHVKPSLDPINAKEPSCPVLTYFSEKLKSRNIQVLDLRIALINAQFYSDNQSSMMYRADDTHWSDEGITVAAQIICRALVKD